MTVAKDSSFVIANCGDKFNGTMLYLNGNGTVTTVTVVGQYSDSNRFKVAQKGGDLEEKITQEATTRAAADTALNSRIDNIVSGATTDTEIIDARQPTVGTAYDTLKARLDGENSEVKNSISELRENIDNQYGGKWIFKKTNPANYLYPMIDWKTENYNFTVGDTYYIKPFFFSSDKFKSTGDGIAVYGYTSPSEYEKLFNLHSIGESNIFTLTKSYVKLRIVFTLTNADTNAFDFGVYFTKLNDALISHTIDLENKVAHLSNKKRNNVLILGDSYSAMGTWIEKLNNKISLGTIVNLAVGSARLKDKYGDRTAYPYSNRPSSAAEWNSNQNTFACQIEKLKRLMVGTDLDVGEIKLYKSSTEYPSIIFVEGGKNDAKDTSTDNYIDAIYSVQRGYYKRKTTDSTAVESNVKIPTPYTDTDRTNFAGAMRYIYGALHNIFPEAMIFFFTPSGINYALDGLHYVEKSNQIKKAAELLCTPIIDWTSNGRLTYADNVVTGDGTVDNPYIGSVASDYTLDSIHPNDKGADYLADEVAKILVAYNLASYLS
ncbi:MAG: hypothetical protein ACLU2K_03900 [Clostridia bacterium]